MRTTAKATLAAVGAGSARRLQLRAGTPGARQQRQDVGRRLRGDVGRGLTGAPAAPTGPAPPGAVPGRHLEGDRPLRQAQRPGQGHLHRRRRHPLTVVAAARPRSTSAPCSR